MSSKKGGGGAPKPGGATAQPDNAWTKPLTAAKKNNSTPNAPPGMGPPSKASSSSSSTTVTNGGSNKALAKQPNASDMLMMNRDKMLSLSAGLVGQKVTVKMTTGTVVEGVYHTFTPFQNIEEDRKNRYVLKEAKVLVRGSGGTSDADVALKEGGDGSTLSIPISKVLHLHADKVEVGSFNKNGSGGAIDGVTNGFATDVQISGTGSGGTNRDLVAAGSSWTVAPTAGSGRKMQGLGAGGGGGLGNQPVVNSRAAALGGPAKATTAPTAALTKGDLAGSIGQWDQFKANEELFNVNSSFDENIYTTQLDTSQIDKRKIAAAERIAREIERTATTNIHLKEERGQKIELDFDEEDLYSGVLTEEMKQRHEAAKEAAAAPGDSSKPSSSGAKGAKKMNYAAALAKADTAGKSGPLGFASSSSSAPAPVASNDKPADDKKGKAASKDSSSSNPAATADATNKDSNKKTTGTESDNKVSAATEKAPKDSANGKAKDAAPKAESKDTEQKKGDGKTGEAKKSSKLNANAKSFTFNPSAKSFTPSFGGGAATPSTVQAQPQHPSQPMADPNMHMYSAHPMAHPYIAAAPMGQPGGMMPMMNPQFQGMRYPGQYAMDQQGMPQQMPNQPQAGMTPNQAAPVVPSSENPATGTPAGENDNAAQKKANADGTAAPNDSDEPKSDSAEPANQQQGSRPQQPQQQQSDQVQPQMSGAAAGGPPQQQSQHHQQQQQQQQFPMHYNMPPQAYYAAGGSAAMGMPPRPGTYPPQFVTGPPHQMPIQQRAGAGPYGMYPAGMPPGGIPPNLQMRGPNGAPYYGGPNNPMMYMGQHGMVDDGSDPNFRGRGGGGGGGRVGGRGGRGRNSRHHTGRGGRGGGRGGYNNNINSSHSNSNSPTPSGGNQSGRNTPQQTQQQPPSSQGSADQSDAAAAQHPPAKNGDSSGAGEQ
eukprot:CAMPEP_0113482632 /NCGR_PEP_ID=MMETSP0014_2-20120614/23021_1 /TAXON_ID=2857 /ORGANISM="Nitzschia sp." /LENGTH=933 /DNA_ID=CAMNT_0000376159 /DNA_START=624 /DNA_END=3425 /DNA_ORIENTATION=- /assembly_acc=CAM_ASM_000159